MNRKCVFYEKTCPLQAVNMSILVTWLLFQIPTFVIITKLLKYQIKYYYYFYYYWYSALGPVWAETRVQSGDWYGSGTLHPGHVLRGSWPLLSPAF